MNSRVNAVRAGLCRGWIEFKQTFTNGQDISNYLIFPIISLIVMILMRNSDAPGTTYSLALLTLPSVLGMSVVFSGLMGAAATLVVGREDGTLLRAKALPHGIIGYLVGVVVYLAGVTLVSVAVLFVPGLLIFDGLDINNAAAWIGLVGIIVIGFVATLPIGAIIGSLGNNPANMGLLFLPIMAMVGVSGIFYPITSLPGWLQIIGQLLPMYWVGLGMRSVLLPDAMASVEIGESWRTLEMVGMLGLWAVIGFVLAPVVMRRMARRESGSNLAERRQRIMQRVQ
ncbi:ABC transporter permease [Antrihabitans spumae]|uniref:Transport permease protein n=1 Tax=Antrihabitans spumae TaxID=3373370 RepID=A0ABW7JLV9_9NOCA